MPNPLRAYLYRERVELVELVMHRLGQMEPPHPLSDVPRGRRGPQARVALPYALPHVRSLPSVQPRGDPRGVGSDAPRLRVEGAREERGLLRVERTQQMFVGGAEQRDPFHLEVVVHLCEVDSDPREPSEPVAGLGEAMRDRIGPDHAMVLEGGERGRRDRVDRLGPDELLDVHRIPVGRVLGARARPEHPLGPRSLSRPGGELEAMEYLEETGVDDAAVGDPDLTSQILRLRPVASRSLSTAVSIRLTKMDATEARRVGSGARASPRRYAWATAS